MQKKCASAFAQPRSTPRFRVRPVVALVALSGALGGVTAQAFELDTGNQDLKVRWDNTLKYSNAVRTKSPSAQLTADPNLDDGNRNFGKGIISNRVDLLTELDVGYKDFGARLSGAAWYDTVYNRTNDNIVIGKIINKT